MTAPDIRQLDAGVVRASVAVVSRVTANDLGRATPCSDWTLAELLAHMTAQHLGFAAASAGRGANPAVWHIHPLGDDPVSAYIDATDQVIAAFAEDDVLQRPFTLPEISTRMTFPGTLAIAFHFVDYLVHSWDVARSLGAALHLPADLVHAALPLVKAIPDGAERRKPDAAFRPSLPAPEQDDPLDRIVAMLGRSPTWPT